MMAMAVAYEKLLRDLEALVAALRGDQAVAREYLAKAMMRLSRGQAIFVLDTDTVVTSGSSRQPSGEFLEGRRLATELTQLARSLDGYLEAGQQGKIRSVVLSAWHLAEAMDRSCPAAGVR